MPQRLLGIALITGGTFVGIIIMALMASYVRSGHFTTATATFGVIIALLLLVLPQFALGVYLIWHSLTDETDSNEEEI